VEFLGRLILDGGPVNLSEPSVNKAENAFKVAKQHWNDYQEKKGINGFLRLQSSVSQSFKQQAQRLSEAYHYVTRATRIYDALLLDYPAEGQELYEQVIREVRLQRRELDDLSNVLELSLLEAKLGLLPVLTDNDGLDGNEESDAVLGKHSR